MFGIAGWIARTYQFKPHTSIFEVFVAKPHFSDSCRDSNGQKILQTRHIRPIVRAEEL